MRSAWRRYACVLAVLLGGILSASLPPGLAATNTIIAGIGGINNGTLSGGDGTGSGRITINVTTLALVKQGRDLAGTVLPNGSNVSSGQQIYFVLYVDNPTITSADNIQMTDLLNESQFTYVPNSLETTVVATGANDAAIWGGVWTALTDGVGGPDDLASITDTGGPAGLDRVTIGAVAGQANQALNIPGGSLRAIRFRVTVN